MALVYVVVQQLENNQLVPRVQGHAVDIHPAMVILLLAVGGTAFGFIGLLTIVPITAILRELFWYVDRRLRGEAADVAFGEGHVGQIVLRRRGAELGRGPGATGGAEAAASAAGVGPDAEETRA